MSVALVTRDLFLLRRVQVLRDLGIYKTPSAIEQGADDMMRMFDKSKDNKFVSLEGTIVLSVSDYLLHASSLRRIRKPTFIQMFFLHLHCEPAPVLPLHTYTFSLRSSAYSYASQTRFNKSPIYICV